MQINREDFLRTLETIQCGLASKEIQEQSTSFAFRDGNVYTFNDEITCSAPSTLDKEFTGAIPAGKMLDILRKLSEASLDVIDSDSTLTFKGKKRKSWLRLEREIALPLDQIEQPEKWRKVPEDFLEAISMVQSCAGKDESKPITTSIHIHPKWVEASDDVQWCRYNLKTGIKESTLVRRDSIKHVVPMGVTEFGETQAWLHFRNGTGWTFACRRYVEMDYPDLSSYLDFEGTKITLPRGLEEAADKADVFSSENTDNNKVLVKLSQGKIRIRGEGISGGHEEVKRVEYLGPPLEFLIAPQMLKDLVKRQTECLISEERLKIESGNWSFVACLAKVENKEQEQTEEEAA